MTAHQAWRTWTFEPAVVLGLAAAAVVYGRGVAALWRDGRSGRGVGRWRVAAFGLGLAAVAAALMSPLDRVADSLLSAHMAQHLLLIVVAAPLLVLGSPGVAMSRAIPVRWRRPLHRAGRWGPATGARRVLSNPVAGWCLATGTLWGWHAPALYDAAVENPMLHVVEHASFLATGLLFWWTALQPSGPRRLPRGAGILYVFAAALQSGALGALMVFASTPIYPIYVVRTGAWGSSPLADQQLAGLLMWVPAFAVYLAAAAGLFVGWLRAVDRDTRRVEGSRPGPGWQLLAAKSHTQLKGDGRGARG